jgi:hypothetical protein
MNSMCRIGGAEDVGVVLVVMSVERIELVRSGQGSRPTSATPGLNRADNALARY